MALPWLTLGTVLNCHAVAGALAALLTPYQLQIHWVAATDPIPGSYWGDCEAGLIANNLYLRTDTPLHSALHEASHYICMTPQRRAQLHTDAAGDYAEEDAVCYLQLCLADQLPGVGQQHLQSDMDAWGYSFRLGSAQAWFEQDAEEAKAWLIQHQIITTNGIPTHRLRAP